MAAAKQRRQYAYDVELLMKDAGLVAASDAAQVSSADKILTVGDAVFKAMAVFDVTAIEIASNTEIYTLCVQGSTSSTFASDVQNLAALPLGATEVNPGGAIDSTVGRYELPFINEQDGVTYPYLRVFTHVAGDIATGINYTAYFSRDTLGGL
jgi:hypothetical protein